MNCIFNSPTIKAFIQEPQRRTILYKRLSSEDSFSARRYVAELQDIPKMFFVVNQRTHILYFGAIDNNGLLRRITQNYSWGVPTTIKEAFQCCLGHPGPNVNLFKANQIIDYFWQSTFISCDWDFHKDPIQYVIRPNESGDCIFETVEPQPKWTLEDLISFLSRDV